MSTIMAGLRPLKCKKLFFILLGITLGMTITCYKSFNYNSRSFTIGYTDIWMGILTHKVDALTTTTVRQSFEMQHVTEKFPIGRLLSTPSVYSNVTIIFPENVKIARKRARKHNKPSEVNSTSALKERGHKNMATSVMSKPDFPFLSKSNTLFLSLRGRFGNHIFQIATLYALARKTGRIPFVLSRISYINKLRQMFPKILDSIVFVEEKNNESFNQKSMIPKWLINNASDVLLSNSTFSLLVEQRPCCFDKLKKQVESSESQHLRLCCFLASWKYFLPTYEDEIRSLFNISDSFQTSVLNRRYDLLSRHFKPHVIPKKLRVVGVHVRRGDLVTFRSLIEDGRRTAGEGYFLRALDYFRGKYLDVIFLVTGNIDGWTNSTFNVSGAIITTHNDPRSDFALLTSCDDVIMSVGTFGWWAAWFANGEVVYFGDHAEKHSKFSKLFCENDYFLPQWKRF